MARPPPSWGRWFRILGANQVAGQTVMSGPDNKPLLVLDQVGKGRVAELLSDQTWLWARGFEGGGPQAELLRRLAHWLMKEPELEAESLSASCRGWQDRRHPPHHGADHAAGDPDHAVGQAKPLTLNKVEPGMWRGTAEAQELGLYRLTDGKLSAVTAAGPLNPKEVADMRATDTILTPLAEATGGRVHWLSDGMPPIRRVSMGESARRARLDRHPPQRRLSRDVADPAAAAAGMAGADADRGLAAARLESRRALILRKPRG